MSMAMLTPGIRAILFCDEVLLSDLEDAVFNLEGLRQQVLVESFPHWHSLNVFLSMAYQRGGTFRGSISLIQDETGEVIGEEDFEVNLDSDDDGIFLPVELGSCIFPEPGSYTGEVYFHSDDGRRVQKGERKLLIIQREG